MTRNELEAILKEALGVEELSSMIQSQIRRYIKQNGYSYKNIARAAYFYFVVRKNEYKEEFGIGIIPHVMEEAVSYFEREKKRQDFLVDQGRILKRLNEEEKDIIVARPKLGRKGIRKINIEDIK